MKPWNCILKNHLWKNVDEKCENLHEQRYKCNPLFKHFFKRNTKFNANILLGFQIHLFATRTTLCLIHIVWWVKVVLFIVQHLFWRWMMQKIFLFSRISLLYGYHSLVFLRLHLKIVSWTDRDQPLDSNNMSCISYTVQHRELVPCSFNSFWTFYTNMLRVGPSDGTVSLYAFRFETYWATSICSENIPVSNSTITSFYILCTTDSMGRKAGTSYTPGHPWSFGNIT